MRGKKGLDYAIILLFVFGILIVALFLAQSKTTQVCAEGSQAPACAGLGSAQAPVLMVNSRTKLVDIFVKSAALLQSLCLNHPFTDGNKRTAWLSTKRFSFINGYHLKARPKEAGDFMVWVDNSKPKLTEISAWLKNHSKKVK